MGQAMRGVAAILWTVTGKRTQRKAKEAEEKGNIARAARRVIAD